MAPDAPIPFPGFPDFRANVTYTPRQFFTVVLPNCSSGTVRIVGYALRQVLGWVDEDGNPTRPRLRLSYRELVEKAGVARGGIAKALDEAVARHCLVCIEKPAKDAEGVVGQSGLYEICWDRSGAYSHDPEAFRGFAYRPAVIQNEPESKGGGTVPAMARVNIPNAFFDHVLRTERLAVLRVVGALLYFSIQWGPAGERKVPVRKSVNDLANLTRMTRQHVHLALTDARSAGYIEATNRGRFDPNAGLKSQSATYAIRWIQEPPLTVAAHAPVEPVPSGDRFKKVDGKRSKKVDGDRNKKVDGNEAKKVDGIKTKTMKTKTDTTTAPLDPERASKEKAAAALGGFEVLTKTGFDTQTARQLADRFPLDQIQRQIDWLSLRAPSRSRLGMLRRAIEQDWEKPEGTEAEGTSVDAHALDFARHYYAGYHGYKGEPRTQPLDKDLAAAAHFVERLLRIDPDPASIPEAGRRFGQLVRRRQEGSRHALPLLQVTLVSFGDELLRTLEGERTANTRQQAESSRASHEERFQPEYLKFLAAREGELRSSHPELYAEFTTDRARLLESASTGPCAWRPEFLAHFHTEEARLRALAQHFAQHRTFPIPSFWEWDARHHRHRFGGPTTQEQHP